MEDKRQKIQEELASLAKANGVAVIGAFKALNESVEVKCLTCSATWSDRIVNFRKGKWCERCKNKTAEEKLYDILIELGVDFVCKVVHPLDPNITYDVGFTLDKETIYIAIDEQNQLEDISKHSIIRNRIKSADTAGINSRHNVK